MSKANLYGGPAAVLAGIPAIWYQVDTPKAFNALGRLAMAMPAKGVLTNSMTVDQAQRRLWPRRQTRVVNPAVDATIFDPDKLPSPQSARSQLGLPQGVPLIGIVGRLQKWKGMHTVVQALPVILRSHSNACCVIVGGPHKLEPEYPAFLDAVIQKARVQDNVILAGYQPNPELWLQAMDIVVHASSQEPFGLVVLEAMSLRKPVIAANSGGPLEIITDGVDGILFPHGNPEALARAILAYLDNPTFAQRTAEAGHSRAGDFTTDRYATTLITAVQDLAGPKL
jgi:glycosyltransferase involved in cell wall biosynthesis